MVSNSMNVGGVAYKKTGLNGESSDNLMQLLDLIEDFNRVRDYEELLSKVGDATKTLMNAEASSIMLLNDEEDELSVVYSTGPVREEVKGKSISKDRGFCGWVVAHKIPLIANDIDKNDEIFGGELSENFITRNLICAPLLDSDNNVIGVLEAVNRNGREDLEASDLPIFQALANHAATAIARGQDAQEQMHQMEEQSMYLTEIHHRVKNDLALISGIVEVESLDIENEEAKGILNNIQSRIKSMAVVYELLSGQGSHNKSELGTYIKKLAEGISSSLKSRNKNIDIDVNTEEIIIDPYEALSCGLILNELILNTYKHAFGKEDDGLITIDISCDNDTVKIDYKDNGQGFPEGFTLQEQSSIGFEMINALAKQLDGTLELYNDRGAHFVMEFESSCTKKKESQPILKG